MMLPMHETSTDRELALRSALVRAQKFLIDAHIHGAWHIKKRNALLADIAAVLLKARGEKVDPWPAKEEGTTDAHS